MEEEKTDYITLKEEYNKLDYTLPDFEKLNEDFEVAKHLEEENQFLIRDIRKIMGQKFSAYLQLFELLKNPTSSPMFVYSLLRNISEEDKKLIKEIYKELSIFQVQSMKLDTIYSEQLESEFLNNGFDKWQELKCQILNLLDKIDFKKEEEKESVKNGYFG